MFYAWKSCNHLCKKGYRLGIHWECNSLTLELLNALSGPAGGPRIHDNPYGKGCHVSNKPDCCDMIGRLAMLLILGSITGSIDLALLPARLTIGSIGFFAGTIKDSSCSTKEKEKGIELAYR
jgi:hypothetical protein